MGAFSILCLGAMSISLGATGAPPTASESDDLVITTHDPSLPNVAIITTGGTIAEKVDPRTGAAVPALSGADLVADVPQLKQHANIGVLNFSNIDSSHMTPEIWANLSRTVDRVLERSDVAGVVVTHGTDTMAEGAYFLDLTLAGDKPVVFTGAMNSASDPHADGPGNLVDAVVQVTSKNARDWGVTVTLNRYVNSSRHVRKTQTTNVQTFESGEKGYLGYVFDGAVTRLNEREHRLHLPVPDELPGVAYIATYAGDDGGFVRHAVHRGDKGIVIDAVGAGNVNPQVFEAIRLALSRDIAVVIRTRVIRGSVEPSYGDVGGGEDLLKHGCILGGDLDGPKARLLLMLALAEHGNDHDELTALFAH